MKKYFDYQVFSDGTIKNKKGRILTQKINRYGYVVLCIILDGIQKNVRAHRIVATCYIDNPENKPQVNHINGIKHDNRVENLEWATPSENMIHADLTGLRVMPKGELSKSSILKQSDIDEIREMYTTNDYTQQEIADIFNVSNQNISCIVNNKSWTCDNFKEHKYIRSNKNNYFTKLNWDIVNKIRKLHETKEYTHQQISDMTGIGRRNISYIVNYKTWFIK